MADRLTFACPHCGTVLTVPAALAGQSGPCPSCAQLIAAPVVAPAAATSPEEPAALGEGTSDGPPPGRSVDRRRRTLVAGLLAVLAISGFLFWRGGGYTAAIAPTGPTAGAPARAVPECLSRMLQARTWDEAGPFFLLTPRQEEAAKRLVPPFLDRFRGAVPKHLPDFDPGPENLSAWEVVSAEDRSRLILLVEKHGGGAKVRWDALAQQLDTVFARVVGGQAGVEEPLYFLVSLVPADRPSLAAAVRWELASAFVPGQARPATAVAGSRAVEDRLRVLTGRSKPAPALVLARLDWKKSPSGENALVIEEVVDLSCPR